MLRILGCQTSKAGSDKRLHSQLEMPNSDKNTHAVSGFTLIELLVVVLILGILMGSAVISIDLGGDQRALQAFGQRLIQRIDLARDRAIQNNQEWGMRVAADDYFFVAFDEEQRQWFAQQQAPFTPDIPPRPVIFQLQVHDQFGVDSDAGMFTPRDGQNNGSKAPGSSRSLMQRTPDLVFFSSGETMPFDLEVVIEDMPSRRADGFRISTDGFQPLRLEMIGAFGQAAR